MKSPLPLRRTWIWTVSGLLVFFFLYCYHDQLWMRGSQLYDSLHNQHKLKDFISSFGAYSPVAYILLQMIQVIVAPIPGGATEFLGGYLFGVKAGFIYAMIGLLLGSWSAFSLARIFEKWAIEKFVSPKILRKFDYLVGHQGVILSFLLFLAPGFPKDALCYILGLTPMHVGVFLFISTIGRMPGTLIATLQGAKAFEHQYRFFLILLAISALIILVFYIYHEEIHHLIKKMRSRK